MSTAPQRRLVPIGDIVAGLADGIDGLCLKLLPQGRRERDEWVVAGDASPFGCSVGVHLRSPRKGVWKAWAGGEAGDALDLVAAVACGGDKGAAVKWALDWLGYEAGKPLPPPSPAAREAADARRAAERQAAAEEEKKRSGAAHRIWLSARPSLKGTPAERYLLGRGIDLGVLGRQPAALRFHPALWDDGILGRHWPALVALINMPGGMTAVHRTWLEVRPDGSVGKAPLFDAKGHSQAKRTFGRIAGGIIPLWRGASGKPLRDAPHGEAVWISEGIEDGLSIACLTGGRDRVVAALNIGNMAQVKLPPACRTVIIAGQNDPWWLDKTGQVHGAAKGLDNAIRHFQAQGRAVRVWRTPPTAPGCKDANDFLRHLAEGREASEGKETA